LYGAVMETLRVNVEHLRHRAMEGFTTVTELADTLVREANISFRQAHSIVSGMVTHALTHQLLPDDLTSDLLSRIAQEKIGREVHLSDAALHQALDPVTFVNKRSGFGGAALPATAKILDSLEDQIGTDQETYQRALQKLAAADKKFSGEIDRLTASS
jgi:argininosuccinate lyase